MSYLTYAEDIQIYVSFNPNTESDKERYMGRLVTCIKITTVDAATSTEVK